MVSGVGLFCISKDTGATLASEFSVKYWFLRFVTVENLNWMSFRGWCSDGVTIQQNQLGMTLTVSHWARVNIGIHGSRAQSVLSLP